MFCSNCGAQAAGNFCSKCGHKLAAAAASDVPAPAAPAPVAPTDDWEQLIDVEALLAIPEIRERVKRHADSASKGTTGEEWLNAFGKLTGSPVPFAALAGVIQPLYARWGIKTGKTRAETLAMPPGRALVAILCSLARRGRKMIDVERAQTGCTLTAELPSDLWSLAGELRIQVQQTPAGTRVELATNIPGQYVDWGKSKRCLDETFEDLRRNAV